MIIAKKSGNILQGKEKRIAFAVNTEGANDCGFAGLVSSEYWPELAHIGKTELCTVLSKKVGEVEFFALCCHSLIGKGWVNQAAVIKKCFDSIPGEEPVASIAIGTGLIGVLSGADFDQIKEGMEASQKEIVLYL
ncbi:MAG: hypothetical protein IKE01_02965 [Clostridia bacterium]|nr:hypothetical protein [Clostridia bacterium]